MKPPRPMNPKVIFASLQKRVCTLPRKESINGASAINELSYWRQRDRVRGNDIRCANP
jgi:hypothetical protein